MPREIKDPHKFVPPKVRRERAEMAEAVHQLEKMGYTVCGSWRREKASVGDLDVLVPPELDFGEQIEMLIGLIHYEPLRSGPMKSEGMVSYRNDPLLLNLWRVPKPQAWAAMLLFATGPNDLNIHMRAAAKSRGWKLSQYGLFDDEDHQRDKGDSEEQIFRLLEMPYLTPPERENWKHDSIRINFNKESTQSIEVMSSDGQTVYHVKLREGKAIQCECIGFTYRSKCRHLVIAEKKAKAGKE